MSAKWLRTAVVLACSLAAWVPSVWAQDPAFPTRSMRIIRKIGSDPMALPPAGMRRFQLSETETERFRRVAASAGITPQWAG